MSFRVCTIFDIGRLVDSYTALYENYLNNSVWKFAQATSEFKIHQT